MNHIETLIMNKVRNALEDLQKSGVGYIHFENTGSINYIIDDKEIVIKVEESSDWHLKGTNK